VSEARGEKRMRAGATIERFNVTVTVCSNHSCDCHTPSNRVRLSFTGQYRPTRMC